MEGIRENGQQAAVIGHDAMIADASDGIFDAEALAQERTCQKKTVITRDRMQ